MAKQVRCPRCETVQPLAHFCVECGLDFKEYTRQLKAQSETTSEAAPAPTAAPRNKVKKIVRCPECGQRQNLSGNCSNCGLDFREYARRIKTEKAAATQPEEPAIPPQPHGHEAAEQAEGLPVSGHDTMPEPSAQTEEPPQTWAIDAGTDAEAAKDEWADDAEDIWVSDEPQEPEKPKPQPKAKTPVKDKVKTTTQARATSKPGTSKTKPQSAQQHYMSGGLRDIGSLLGDAWGIYKDRFTPLFLLNLLTIPFMIGPPLALGLLGMIAGVFGSEMLAVGAGMGATLGFIVGMVLMFVPIAGLIAAINDSGLGVKDALAVGFSKLWSFIWIIGLMGFIIPGGYMLLIVPGLLFTVWFLLAQFIVIIEPERGMGALLKSKAYIKGQWWPVMGRLLLTMLLSGVAGIVPLFGALLINPYIFAILYLIYIDLKEEKGQDVAYPDDTWDKLKWPLLALAGYIVPIVIIILVGISDVGQETIRNLSSLEGMMEQEQSYDYASSPEISTDKASYAPGEIITVQYSGMPGNQTDWISIVLATDPDNVYMDGYLYYTEGKTGDTITFSNLPEGVYEIRAYFDWNGGGGYNVKARKRVTITSPSQTGTPDQYNGMQSWEGSGEANVLLDSDSYAPGQSITVNFIAPDGYPKDAWIGIIPANVPHGNETQNDQHDISYQYLSGRTTGTMTFTAPTSAGDYDIRMHDTDNNGREVASTGFSVK